VKSERVDAAMLRPAKIGARVERIPMRVYDHNVKRETWMPEEAIDTPSIEVKILAGPARDLLPSHIPPWVDAGLRLECPHVFIEASVLNPAYRRTVNK
jgi:hypothetical protein